MEKEVWKWLFSDFSDKSLILLICGINETLNNSKTKITIKGVSDLSKIRADQIYLFRNRIETELNKTKNISKVKFYLRKSTESNQNNKIVLLSEKEPIVILDEIKKSDAISIHDIIMHLMIQTDLLKINKGIDIYQINKSTQGETKKIVDPLENTTVLQDKTEHNSDLEIKRLKDEIIDLQAERNELLVEKKEAIKAIKEYKKTIIQVESEKNTALKSIQKLEREITTRKADIGTKDRKNQELQEALLKSEETWNKLKIEHSKLLQRIIELEEEKTSMELIQVEGNKSSKTKRIVSIIDRNLPDGLDGLPNINFHLINPTQLEEVILTNEMNNSDEIWFIKFRLPATKQNLLNDKYGKKVTGFKTIIELKNYCNIIY
jgi:chromosome segregation ATPase